MAAYMEKGSSVLQCCDRVEQDPAKQDREGIGREARQGKAGLGLGRAKRQKIRHGRADAQSSS